MKNFNYYAELLSYTLYLTSREEEFSFDEISENYKKLISRSQELAEKNNFTDWKEYFFPIAAFIYEQILCSNLKDKSKWVKNKLQKTFFNTDQAGEEFFQKLENIPDEQKDLRILYELCLALGFKGKYYDSITEGKLEDIKYSNLKKLTSNPNLSLPQSLFTSSYEKNTARQKRNFTPWKGNSWKTWIIIILPLIILIGLYLFYSYELNLLIDNYFKGI